MDHEEDASTRARDKTSPVYLISYQMLMYLFICCVGFRGR